MNRRSLLRSMFGAACLSVAQRIMPAACEVPRVVETRDDAVVYYVRYSGVSTFRITTSGDADAPSINIKSTFP